MATELLALEVAGKYFWSGCNIAQVADVASQQSRNGCKVASFGLSPSVWMLAIEIGACPMSNRHQDKPWSAGWAVPIRLGDGDGIGWTLSGRAMTIRMDGCSKDGWQQSALVATTEMDDSYQEGSWPSVWLVASRMVRGSQDVACRMAVDVKDGYQLSEQLLAFQMGAT